MTADHISLFRPKAKQILIDYNDFNKKLSCDDAIDKIVKLLEDEINELVVEERIHHRSICSRTVRKIKEKILYPSLDPASKNIEMIAPERKKEK